MFERMKESLATPSFDNPNPNLTSASLPPAFSNLHFLLRLCSAM
jgi:hypothetical protein